MRAKPATYPAAASSQGPLPRWPERGAARSGLREAFRWSTNLVKRHYDPYGNFTSFTLSRAASTRS